MTLRKHLAVAAMTLTVIGVVIPAANAQTITVNGTVSGSAPTFTYSYLVTPTTGSIGLLTFNFSDANITAGASPAGFTNLVPSGMGNGLFAFLSSAVGGTTTATTFTFTSPDNIGGTLGATNASTASGSSGVASVIATGVAPAPEPSQTAALGLGVLGLMGMTLNARRRKLLPA